MVTKDQAKWHAYVNEYVAETVSRLDFERNCPGTSSSDINPMVVTSICNVFRRHREALIKDLAVAGYPLPTDCE